MESRIKTPNACYQLFHDFRLWAHVFFCGRSIRNFFNHLLEIRPEAIKAPFYEFFTVLIFRNFLDCLNHLTNASLINFFGLKLSKRVGDIAEFKAK